MIDIYERAYSIHYGAGPLGADWPSGVMQNITGGDAHTLSTWGGSGWFRWPRKEDHQYTDAQWDEIQQAVQDGRPVVGLTGRGDFSHGDAVTATTDTNRSGTVGDGPDQTPIKETDQEGTYRIGWPSPGRGGCAGGRRPARPSPSARPSWAWRRSSRPGSVRAGSPGGGRSSPTPAGSWTPPSTSLRIIIYIIILR